MRLRNSCRRKSPVAACARITPEAASGPSLSVCWISSIRKSALPEYNGGPTLRSRGSQFDCDREKIDQRNQHQRGQAQNAPRKSKAPYPATPIAATGIPIRLEYSLRFTMSQLNFWLKSQYAVADFA